MKKQVLFLAFQGKHQKGRLRRKWTDQKMYRTRVERNKIKGKKREIRWIAKSLSRGFMQD